MSEEITGGVGKYVVGQIGLAALNGVLCFIVLVSIGGKAAIIWAFVAFLLALIPLIGTVVSSVVVSLSQLLLASPLTALVILIYFLIYMQIEAYVISPRIMNKAVSIPGSVVVIAALAGGTLMGVLGALVAIPIAASIILIIKQVVVPRMETR
jgi:predicted PurR-regulated permease PerM